MWGARDSTSPCPGGQGSCGGGSRKQCPTPAEEQEQEQEQEQEEIGVSIGALCEQPLEFVSENVFVSW